MKEQIETPETAQDGVAQWIDTGLQTTGSPVQLPG